MAEQTNQTNQTNTPPEQQTAPNYDEIFNKLDAILEKRADGLAKSALKDMSLRTLLWTVSLGIWKSTRTILVISAKAAIMHSRKTGIPLETLGDG